MSDNVISATDLSVSAIDASSVPVSTTLNTWGLKFIRHLLRITGSTDGLSCQILDGKNANRGEFPHVVSLQRGGSFSGHFCGGTLIHPQWVLTSAHCIINLTASNIIVKAGKYNVNKWENTEQTAVVQKRFLHEGYIKREESSPHDLALLKLHRPFKLNDYVQTIALPAPDSEPKGNATFSGWGGTSKTNMYATASILHTATLPLLDANACKKSIDQLNQLSADQIHEAHVCTSAGAFKQSAGPGDSGAPLTYNNPGTGKKEVIGIASWIVYPYQEVAPSVFTKVSSYIDWIRAKISTNK